MCYFDFNKYQNNFRKSELHYKRVTRRRMEKEKPILFISLLVKRVQLKKSKLFSSRQTNRCQS